MYTMDGATRHQAADAMDGATRHQAAGAKSWVILGVVLAALLVLLLAIIAAVYVAGKIATWADRAGRWGWRWAERKIPRCAHQIEKTARELRGTTDPATGSPYTKCGAYMQAAKDVGAGPGSPCPLLSTTERIGILEATGCLDAHAPAGLPQKLTIRAENPLAQR